VRKEPSKKYGFVNPIVSGGFYDPDRDRTRARLSVRVKRLIRVILARPDLCGPEHDAMVYNAAKALGHHVISYRRDLCPEPLRY